MKKTVCGVLALILASVFGLRVDARSATPGLPHAGEEQFPAAAAITITNVAGFPCTILLTGPATVKRGAPLPGSQVTITTELTSMELTGTSPDLGGTVRLLVGTNFVGRSSTGQIKGNLLDGGQTATSYFDVFFKLELPSGTNLFNTNSVRLTTSVRHIPQLDVTYTNISSLALIQVNAGTTNASGNLTSLWFTPSQPGNEARLGVSQDVIGNLVPGIVSSASCTDSNVLASMTTTVSGQSLLGSITANTVCDELGLDGVNIFEATWNSVLSTNFWRGSHQGTFRILQVSGSATNVFATGMMDGNNGVGTHRSPLPEDCEECAPCNQFEGKLTGKIVAGDFKGGAIEAGYAGQFLDTNGVPIACSPLPVDPPSGMFRMAIDGVAIVKGCLPLPSTNVAAIVAESIDQGANLPVLRASSKSRGATGSGPRLDFSRSVAGTVSNVSVVARGSLTTSVCADTNDLPAAATSIHGQELIGTMTVNTNCDQLALVAATNLFASTSTIRAVLDSDLRAPDWRGNHSGKFIIVKGNTILAKGTLEGVNGVGTHRLPALTNDCETCDSCGHFEGKLRGKIIAPAELKGAILDAMYTGQFVDSQTNSLSCCPTPSLPPSGAFRMAIDGVVITKDCVPQ